MSNIRVLTGKDAKTGQNFGLARNLYGSDMAWGWYLKDKSSPIRLLIQSPHPVADENSEDIALALWRVVPGALLMVAGAHRKAGGPGNNQGLADVPWNEGSMFHKVAASYMPIPQVQIHGFANSTAPDYDIVLATGSAPTNQLIQDIAAVFEPHFRVGKVWEGVQVLTAVGNRQSRLARDNACDFVHIEINRTTRLNAQKRALVVSLLAGVLEDTVLTDKVRVGFNGRVNYLCDGTADNVQLKDAILEAQQTGKVVELQPGTYDIAGQTAVLNKGNIAIKGAGMGVTVLKRSFGTDLSMFDFGNSAGPVQENLYISDLTIDLNSTGIGWGLVVSWFKNVTIERCSFINPTNNMKAALFLGKYTGGSDAFEAHTITVRDCLFDYSGKNLGWEYVGVIGARDVTFDNCRWRATGATNQSRPGVLAYNTEQFRVLNCFVDHARITVGGRGSYNISNTQFDSGLLFLDQARDVTVTGCSFRAWGSTTGMEIGIRCKGGYKTMQDVETPWYISENTVFNNENIIIQGNTFRDCKPNAIYARTVTESQLEVLDCRDIAIFGNKIDGSTGIPIVAFGDRIRIAMNEILNGNTANANASSYHMYVAGEETIITDNYASSPNVATDIVVDQARNATLVPTMNLRARDNIFKSATRIKYFAASDGASAVPSLTEPPENVTVIGELG